MHAGLGCSMAHYRLSSTAAELCIFDEYLRLLFDPVTIS
jgi:hypothetical protein